VRTLVALGLALNNRKLFAEARTALHRALEMEPDNVDAIAALSESEEGLGNLQSAEAHEAYVRGRAFLDLRSIQGWRQALQQFDELANMKDLYSNSGDFLKAVTLLERNKPGDKEEAKKLLQKVVHENEDGSQEAGEWLKKF